MRSSEVAGERSVSNCDLTGMKSKSGCCLKSVGQMFAAVSKDVPHKEPRAEADQSKRPGGTVIKQPGCEDGRSCGEHVWTRDTEERGPGSLSDQEGTAES